MKNNKNRKEYFETDYQYENKNQNIQNRRQQNIPAVSWVPQGYSKPQYQTPYLQRSNPYPTFQNTPQPRFLREFQPRFRNNQNKFQYISYNQLIPRMNQLVLCTVPGQTQPMIEFAAENRENLGENGQRNFQKQCACNVNRSQKSGIWNNKKQDNPNWLKQGAQLQNANANENLMQLNRYNCKEPGHFKRECLYFCQNQGN